MLSSTSARSSNAARRILPRTFPAQTVRRASRLHNEKRRFSSLRASSPYAFRRQQHFLRAVLLVGVTASLGSAYTWYHGGHPLIAQSHADSPAPDDEDKNTPEGKPQRIDAEDLVFEQPFKATVDATKGESRDQLSSQHLQVRKSWENPGVWCWGANDGKVASPDGKESLVKNPKWMTFFDGRLLRDLKLTQTFGAAISEEGDLYQWGSAFSKKAKQPTLTLRGKDLKSLAVSQDRVFALSKSGDVYSLSASQEEQTLGPKPQETSWIPFWGGRSPVSYRRIIPSSLGWTERVTALAAGQEHGVLLTSSGRVFTFAAANDSYPTRGQFGVSGLNWFTRPAGPFDTPHEVPDLHGMHVEQIATGDHHTVVRERRGRVFAWGDNQRGQLGIGETTKDAANFDTPQLVALNRLYAGAFQKPVVTSVAAGGNTSFFTVDATRVQDPSAIDDPSAPRARGSATPGRITADVWAAGHGIWGQLGNGRWTHVASSPILIQPLSGLFEYDEATRRAVPIRVFALSLGSNYAAAILDNITYLDASEKTNENDTNWGRDVLFWGNNEFYQLGTGKRNNCTTPTYIRPLDRRAEVEEGNRAKEEVHRFHATPRSSVYVPGRGWVAFEQRVECGRGVTAVYSGV